MATISIVQWEEFQHYRDRDPPWIKFYRDTLTSVPWMLGSDDAKLMIATLLLIAARFKNQIPADVEVIRSMAHLKMPENRVSESLRELVSRKFIAIHGLNGVESAFARTLLAKCYTEKERSEQGRSSEIRAETLSSSETRPVEAVFEHWKSVWSKPRSKLDPKRRSCIVKALKTYDQVTLCESISGYRNSAHHLGQNDRDTAYDDISLFLRDAQHIDAGLQYAKGPITRSAPKTRFDQLTQDLKR